MNALFHPVLAGFELSDRAATKILLVLGLGALCHLSGLAFVIIGHRAMWRHKNPVHLCYVLPLSWYWIGLGAYALALNVEQELDWPATWPLGQDPEWVQGYVVVLFVTALLLLHGFWVERLLRQPARPALCGLAWWSAIFALLFPPAGMVLARAGARRIRQSGDRLWGRSVAWISFGVNAMMLLWILVVLADGLYDRYQLGTWPSSPPPPAVAPVQTLYPPSAGANPPAADLHPTTPTATAVPQPATGKPAARADRPPDPSVSRVAPSGFNGSWVAAFTFERNTRNTAEPRHPWISFAFRLQQQGDTVRGTMEGGGVSGVLSGKVENGHLRGTLRLSWDSHDWEELTLTLHETRERATGRAVFRANPEEQHFYSLELQRR